jgi:hypothetical protein
MTDLFLSPLRVGFSRREIQPGTLLILLRLADMFARDVTVTPEESCIEVDLESEYFEM